MKRLIFLGLCAVALMLATAQSPTPSPTPSDVESTVTIEGGNLVITTNTDGEIVVENQGSDTTKITVTNDQ
jgi:hypothetical protein